MAQREPDAGETCQHEEPGGRLGNRRHRDVVDSEIVAAAATQLIDDPERGGSGRAEGAIERLHDTGAARVDLRQSAERQAAVAADLEIQKARLVRVGEGRHAAKIGRLEADRIGLTRERRAVILFPDRRRAGSGSIHEELGVAGRHRYPIRIQRIGIRPDRVIALGIERILNRRDIGVLRHKARIALAEVAIVNDRCRIGGADAEASG